MDNKKITTIVIVRIRNEYLGGGTGTGAGREKEAPWFTGKEDEDDDENEHNEKKETDNAVSNGHLLRSLSSRSKRVVIGYGAAGSSLRTKVVFFLQLPPNRI